MCKNKQKNIIVIIIWGSIREDGVLMPGKRNLHTSRKGRTNIFHLWGMTVNTQHIV